MTSKLWLMHHLSFLIKQNIFKIFPCILWINYIFFLMIRPIYQWSMMRDGIEKVITIMICIFLIGVFMYQSMAWLKIPIELSFQSQTKQLLNWWSFVLPFVWYFHRITNEFVSLPILVTYNFDKFSFFFFEKKVRTVEHVTIYEQNSLYRFSWKYLFSWKQKICVTQLNKKSKTKFLKFPKIFADIQCR